MELVFIYIDGSATEFIEKKGFNFSANYYFYIDIDNERYILKLNPRKKELPADFFDNSSCITNVTAIVGENGSGKTTLLNYLAMDRLEVRDLTCWTEYKDYYEEKYARDKYIAIYLENEKLVCYHNVEKLLNQTDINDNDIFCLYGNSSELSEMVRKNEGFINISKIYLTNSMYPAWNGISNGRKGSIDQIFLNVNTLNVLKDMFYEKKCKNINLRSARHNQYQDILREKRKPKIFSKFWM